MDNNTIEAPFTEEQVKKLNEYQEIGLKFGIAHPFTCCSHNNCNRTSQPNEGTLIATKEGWICPCGNYRQNWAYNFMLETEKLKESPFYKMQQKS